MNNILLVGNGFDLAHGLLTKYEHFLYLIKNWDEFYCAFEKEKNNSKKQDSEIEKQSNYGFWVNEEWAKLFAEKEKPIDKYIRNASEMDEPRIEQFGNIIKDNSWIKYYSHCEAEIDGWIDFEKEIYPVIELFNFIFSYDYELEYNRDSTVNFAIPLNRCGTKILKTAELWDRYIDIGPQKLYLKNMYVAKNYGILKKKILKKVRSEFDDFVIAFEIYLHEFVYKKENIQTLKQIKKINADYVISFNYTLTEKLYGISEGDVHHIHGMIREDLESGKNNMVVGVNEQENQSMDFIYFVKYFQRIQKDSGVRYKNFINIERENEDLETIREKYKLYVYGHSLDETDEDILKYIMGNKDEDGNLKLKPKQVIIYYYDDFDYEQKVINLIKLYGRPIVEEYMEAKLFDFVPTSKEVCNV